MKSPSGWRLSAVKIYSSGGHLCSGAKRAGDMPQLGMILINPVKKNQSDPSEASVTRKLRKNCRFGLIESVHEEQ
jgi:hypothetical protein